MALGGSQKVCLWAIILGILALITGSAAPYWLKLDVLAQKTNIGLWYHCVNSDNCKVSNWLDYSWGDFTIWFYILHGAAGVASLICIFALFVALAKLCGEGQGVTGLGVFTLIAGLLGIVAAVIFYLKAVNESLSPGVAAGTKDWAYYAFAAGTGVTTLFSVIILCLPGESQNQVRPFY